MKIPWRRPSPVVRERQIPCRRPFGEDRTKKNGCPKASRRCPVGTGPWRRADSRVRTVKIVGDSPLGWSESIEFVGDDRLGRSKSVKFLAVERSARLSSLIMPARRGFDRRFESRRKRAPRRFGGTFEAPSRVGKAAVIRARPRPGLGPERSPVSLPALRRGWCRRTAPRSPRQRRRCRSSGRGRPWPRR
jgi:hypothetical protein